MSSTNIFDTISCLSVYIYIHIYTHNKSDPAAYPELCNQDVSDAAQNCHTVKNIPGIFEIILRTEQKRETKEEVDEVEVVKMSR